MLDLRIMLLVTFLCYMLLYLFCWAVDKDDIESYQKKIKLNKYTNKLFFLWKRSEKIYWIVYIVIITESLIFILLWISYLFKIVFIYKILLDLYIQVYLSSVFILGVKVLIKRIKDFISGKSR